MANSRLPFAASLKAVLFDLDGTLLDSAELHYEIYVQLFAEYGITFTRQQYIDAYSPNWTVTYKILGLPEQLVPEANRRWLELASGRVPALFEGVPELLDHLAQPYRLGIITSGTRSRVLHDLEANGIEDWFEVIITGSDVSVPKPSPEGILKALWQLGIPPGQALYVGDTEVDYQAASAAGTHFVAVVGGHAPLPAGLPCTCLPHISELQDLLP